MKLERPSVILFGAGATRGGLASNQIPPPVDADFFDIAGQVRGHGTPRFAKSVLSDVWDLYQRTSGIGLESYYRDVETRERIDRIARARYRPMDWQTRRNNLEELIRRVLIHTTCDTTTTPHSPIISQLHRKVLEKLKPDDTLLTFNYDTVIEEAFETADLWSPVDGYGPGVYGYRLDWARKWLATRNAPLRQTSKVLLLKLHGSLGWALYQTNTVRMKPRPYVIRPSAREVIAILPPGWNKRIDKNPYKQIWKQARSRLEQCRSVVILGYSLPETDLLARGLFAEVVRRRATGGKWLKQLHVADPSPAAIQRLVDMFTPALGANGSVFKYSGLKEFAERLAGP
jgi:hypothetical protein